ncbi:MAG: hypothetical protein ABR928_21770 [Terracidiphilus sp.]|jgi:hypothetical protein
MSIVYRPGKPQECRFIKSDGRRCHSMSMRGMACCYFHLPAHRRPIAKGRPLKTLRIEFQPPTNGQPRKTPFAQLKTAIKQGRLDRRTGELCAYGMRLLTRTSSSTASGNPARPA